MAPDSKTARADGVLEEHGDGRITLRYERHFDHPIERVWAALTETAEMVAWWGDADVDLVEGGSSRCAGSTPTTSWAEIEAAYEAKLAE